MQCNHNFWGTWIVIPVIFLDKSWVQNWVSTMSFYPSIFTLSQTVCLIDPSNNQLVKDEGTQIFYSIRLQTKPIGIGVNCENPSQSLLHNATPTTQTYDRALIPLVGLCALLIHLTTNWWRMKGHKSFIEFDRRLSPLVLEWIVKTPHNPSLKMQYKKITN